MRYGVIGGGVLGLTAALRLLQRGHEVVVIERAAVPGGLAAGFEVAPGLWLEKFYHHLFRSDRHAIALIEELGLADRLLWRTPVTTVLRDGGIHQLDSARSVLAFSPLPVIDRFRLGAGVGYLRLKPRPGGLERVTAGDWVPRAMGRRVYDTVWGPLLRGKFGASAGDVSMAWLWARIHSRTASLGYLRGGFHQLYSTLSGRIESLGGDVRYGCEVRRIGTVGDGGLEIEIAGDGPAERFDRVVSTLPTALTVRLTPEMPASYLERYPAPKAFGAHCLVLALDRRLTDVYWIGVNEPDYPFLALVEHTNMLAPEDYGGRHLVYLGNYRAHDDPLFKASTAEVIDQFAPYLRRINPDFDPAWIRESWSFGAPFAQPIVTPAFRHQIPPFESPVAGLSVANMFQVYPYDRGQNYSIELAERLVAHLDAG
jgi:protoporphyrinogen oxidase